MEKQEFKVMINASREQVWDVLWGDTTYPVWTSFFSEGSTAETDWKKDSKVYFLNAEQEGMIALITESKVGEQMSFKTIGAISKGVEDYERPETKAWAGAMEEYFLQTKNGQTELVVRMDLTEEFKDYFMTAFPKALEKVRELSEQK